MTKEKSTDIVKLGQLVEEVSFDIIELDDGVLDGVAGGADAFINGTDNCDCNIIIIRPTV